MHRLDKLPVLALLALALIPMQANGLSNGAGKNTNVSSKVGGSKSDQNADVKQETTNKSKDESTQQNSKGGDAEVASWLASVAAQRAGYEIAYAVKNLCSQGNSCLISNWKTFRAASLRGRKIVEQFDEASRGFSKAQQEIRGIDSTACSTPTPIIPQPAHVIPRQAMVWSSATNKVLDERVIDALKNNYGSAYEALANSTSSTGATTEAAAPVFTPLLHANAWVTAVGALGTGVVAIAKSFAPTVSMSPDSASGLVSDDLMADVLQSMEARGLVAKLPDGASDDIETRAEDVRGKLSKLKSEINAKLNALGPATPQKCSAIKKALTDLDDDIGSVSTKLTVNLDSALPATDPEKDPGEMSAAMLADEAYQAAMYRQNAAINKNLVLQVDLGSSAVDRGTYTHWWGTYDLVMHAAVHARYQVVDAKTGALLHAGTVAVICQSLETIKAGAKPYAEEFSGPGGGLPADAHSKPMCTSQPTLGRDEEQGVASLPSPLQIISQTANESGPTGATSPSQP
ncbi:hypothetical protein [Dyella japonica]|uniref:hypothetical protein n=1 Tax=Dyella japonica TaxID=231455 RepID=UPI0002F7B6BC|nr:hypothetical protein [Dyella japonica]